jgi:hypothetical protein
MVFGELSNVSVCLARDLERSERTRASGVRAESEVRSVREMNWMGRSERERCEMTGRDLLVE